MVFPGLGVRVRTFNREPANTRPHHFNPSPEITPNFFSTFAPRPTSVTPQPWTQGIDPHLESHNIFPTSYPSRLLPSRDQPPLRLPRPSSRPSSKTERPSSRPTSSRPGSEQPRSISPALSVQRGTGKVPIFARLPKNQVGGSFFLFKLGVTISTRQLLNYENSTPTFQELSSSIFKVCG